MAQLKLFDSTGDATTTSGTGTLTGGGTQPTGYQTPSSGGVSDGDTTIIRIESSSGADWEVCETVYTLSGTTWSRGTLIGSSTGSRVSFSAGTKNIYCVSPKEMMSGSIMTTTGDMLYRDASKGARLPIGTAGQMMSSTGSAPQWITIVGGGVKAYSNTDTTGNTIINAFAETAFASSYTVSANSLAAGDVIRIKLWGVYGTSVVAPNITMKVKIGSTTVLNTGAITAVAGVTNGGWFGDIDLSFFTVGASGTCDAQAYGEFATAATTGLSVNVPNAGTQVIDTTTSQAITITITWSAASASNTITLRQIEILALKAQGNSTPVGVTVGGTGLTSVTTGDLFYGSASNVISKLGIGSAGQFLAIIGGIPTWCSANTYDATPTNPTANSGALMLGLAGAITPNRTGNLYVVITGMIKGSSTGLTYTCQIAYGTGTAPINGAASTGTLTGKPNGLTVAGITNLQNEVVSFTCQGPISGAALSTALWIDLVTSSSGTCTVTNIVIHAEEK